ncbi:MAG: aldose epimerase family protein [Lachnospiraceae bacterium]|nr:aldose epimerase family protein [Lachnospiraceae bacterium]
MEKITLKNKNGMQVDILRYGATIQAIRFPDGRDVVLGYDDPESYKKGESYFGATVGRTAGLLYRAQFTLNGKTYHLYKNAGEECLHGGKEGFNAKIFEVLSQDDRSVRLHYLSPDMEEGYPGNLDLTVTYTLDDDNALWIGHDAVCDQDTIINITNHSYFNLDGQESDSILDHYLMIDADGYCPTDADGTARGTIDDVTGTPMDFRTPMTIGSRINDDFEQVHIFGGYDHSYALNPGSLVDGKPVKPCIVVENADRSHRLEVFTDYPGVQFYAGNSLGDGDIGKNGKKFTYRQALCLETQYYSDAMHNPAFPSIVLKAGERYGHTTVYRFA